MNINLMNLISTYLHIRDKSDKASHIFHKIIWLLHVELLQINESSLMKEAMMNLNFT